LLFCRPACADVRKILAHTHFSEKHWSLENVIARCAATVPPFPLDVVRGVIGADLLAVTVNAAVRSVNVLASLNHTRLRLRINVGAILFHLRIKMSDLPIRDHRQSHP
jgi:hypothetical protein